MKPQSLQSLDLIGLSYLSIRPYAATSNPPLAPHHFHRLPMSAIGVHQWAPELTPSLHGQLNPSVEYKSRIKDVINVIPHWLQPYLVWLEPWPKSECPAAASDDDFCYKRVQTPKIIITGSCWAF